MDGLNRFDGYSFKTYQHDKNNPNSLNQNIISALLTDKSGMLWVGTDSGGLARYDPTTGRFTHFLNEPQNPQSPGSNSIYTVYEDSTGTLWIGAIGGGLNRFDPTNNTFKRYTANPQNKNSIIDNTVRCIVEQSPGVLLIGTPNGIDRFDIKNEAFTRCSPLYAQVFCRGKSGTIWIGTVAKGLYILKPRDNTPGRYHFPSTKLNEINQNTAVNAIYQDRNDAIWIGTSFHGLFKIDTTSGAVDQFQYENGKPNGVASNYITSIFQDSGGIMWFGTNFEGINRFDPSTTVFHDYSTHFAGKEIKSYFRDIYEIRSNDLWIATAGAGLLHYNTESEALTYFNHSPKNLASISCDDLFFIAVDPCDTRMLWIGTYNGLNRFDREKRISRRYFNPTAVDYQQSNYFRCGLPEADGTIWLGTGGAGIAHFNPQNNTFKNYRHDPQNPDSLSDDAINFIHKDRSGYLWIGTASGFNRFNPKTGKFKTYFTQSPHLISSQVFSICESDDGILWIGTLGDGLVRFDPRTEQVIKIYNKNEGLLSTQLFAILKDEKKNLWIGSSSGIFKFDTQTEHFIQFDSNDGLLFSQFCINGHAGKNGRFYFGHLKGMVAFYPDQVKPNNHVPPIAITECTSVNRDLDFSPLLFSGKPIRLTYKDRVICIEFAALDFSAPMKNHYAFQLQGFDKNWRNTDAANRRVTYTNLDPGEYTLMVKGSNNHEIWNPAPTVLKLQVIPPFWKTFLFRLLVTIIILALISLFYRIRMKVIQAQKERLAAENANRSKSEFLARMSHEIRTPLNSIIGFTDILLETQMSHDQYDYVKTIQRSGDILLTLINDILDFSKVEAGQLSLEFIEFDPEEAACDAFTIILPRLGDKPIEILCHCTKNVPPRVIGDLSRFRQVLVNLMSNAAKFTEAGKIELNMAAEISDEQSVKLHIALNDTGIGIPPDKLETIFEVFHQADDSVTRKYGGSGLGLAICRQLAKLMNGNVWAESEPGKGSTFHFTSVMRRVPGLEEDTACSQAVKSLAGKKILVVDDNRDNLKIITYLLKSINISTHTLMSGHEVIPVLTKAEKKHAPFDLCILDINMPELSGIDVARQIRSLGAPLSRIPLLGLSSANLSRVKADDAHHFSAFLMKPLQRKRLLGTLEQLLFNISTSREKLKETNSAGAAKPSGGLRSNKTILLAEDNLVNRKLVAYILSREGYQLEIAETGQQALEKFLANPDKFALILMDVQMPVLDGIEAVKIIRSKGFTGIPVIAMTAQSLTGDREKCLEAGMNDYVSKPIKKTNFLEVINKWLYSR
jgi:signal transduction histidine kinase/CheY-like chemotaxis protein/ligand-binding sensor domain-containing protein